jgi:hypothetical protein
MQAHCHAFPPVGQAMRSCTELSIIEYDTSNRVGRRVHGRHIEPREAENVPLVEDAHRIMPTS